MSYCCNHTLTHSLFHSHTHTYMHTYIPIQTYAMLRIVFPLLMARFHWSVFLLKPTNAFMRQCFTTLDFIGSWRKAAVIVTYASWSGMDRAVSTRGARICGRGRSSPKVHDPSGATLRERTRVRTLPVSFLMFWEFEWDCFESSVCGPYDMYLVFRMNIYRMVLNLPSWSSLFSVRCLPFRVSSLSFLESLCLAQCPTRVEIHSILGF